MVSDRTEENLLKVAKAKFRLKSSSSLSLKVPKGSKLFDKGIVVTLVKR